MSHWKTWAAALMILLACGATSSVNAQSTCTATCADGIHTVSCTSTPGTSCYGGIHSVQCNGQTYTCPGCYATCMNAPSYECYSYSNQCSSWFDNSTFTYWISCNGVAQQCPDCGRPWCG